LVVDDSLPKGKSEAISLGLRRYFTGKTCKSGHLEPRDAKHGCLGCRREKKRAYKKTPKGIEARRRSRSTPSARAAKALQGKRRREEIKADPILFEACRAKERDQKRRYYSTPLGKAYRKQKSFFKEEKIRIATPKWCNKTVLNRFISNCPEGHHVDHIIPLRGTTVWGLNIPENLQYLPAQENLSKGNKVDPFTLEAVVCVLPEHRQYAQCLDKISKPRKIYHRVKEKAA